MMGQSNRMPHRLVLLLSVILLVPMLSVASVPATTTGEGAIASVEAVRLYESPEAAEVRETWDVSIDLLMQIDYQLDLRKATDYLDASDAHIIAILRYRDRASESAFRELGLFMTEAEWAEFSRRQRVGMLASDVTDVLLNESPRTDVARERPGVAFGSTFAGIWQDQMQGGRLHLAVVRGSSYDSTALFALMESSGDLVIAEVAYSWDQLGAFDVGLQSAALSQRVSVFTYPDPASNTVVVRVSGDKFELPASVPADAVSLLFNQDTRHTIPALIMVPVPRIRA